ncbi:hypothetical protein JX266_005980 [Neoarthrinium moseri]|nr:hypothetical protein JX266_005980 [Neoarthrinium moseri]
MAEEDFEIDIYGSAENEAHNDAANQDANAQSYESNTAITVANGSNNSTHAQAHRQDDYDGENQDGHGMDTSQDDAGRSRSVSQQPHQGVKRKEGSDDRPVDPGATNCLMISELNWWNTDDDIRKWVVQAGCEDELKDITFSEHKVNGKSKGQAYLDFSSVQAATATKHQIDISEPIAGVKKATVVYSSPHNNPFKTLPKDAPARGNKDQGARGGSVAGGYNNRGSYNSNFRGRGNFNNGPRGGGGGGGFNPNFGGGNMGYNNNMGGGFNPSMGGGFNAGYNNRGGGMMRGGPGMRGGRGGGMNNMMGNMGNMGMPMGGMPGNMGMGMMGGGMPNFNGMQPQFNPNFFGNQAGGNDWQQNPHGAKRQRGE